MQSRRAERRAVPSAGAEPRASGHRQIVVCCDGTNSTLTGRVKDSNVVQLFELLTAERAARQADDPHGPEQVLFYDPGVGSPTGLPPTGITGVATDALRRLAGLALGTGIYENIGQAYLHLCREYGRHDEGRASTTDEIYVFGFSRGAFTARAVAGMVNLFGLIRPEHEVLLPTLLSIYFAGENATASAGELGALALPAGRATGPAVAAVEGSGAARALEAARVALDQQPARTVDHRGVESGRVSRRAVSAQIRESFTSEIGGAAVVHFVGVWDTVDSVGILPGVRTRISSKPTIRGKRYRHVRHALALDEHRRQFLPRPFDGAISPGQSLEQLWFRGAHSDIGGRRPAAASPLSWVTLDWMVREAMACGLRCRPPEPQAHPEDLVEVIGDQLRAQPAWALTGMALRDPARAPGHGIRAAPGRGGGTATGPPVEHESVGRFSPPATGPRPTGVPGSPWERGNGPRPSALLLQIAVLAIVTLLGLVASGALATPGPTGWDLAGAARAGAELLGEQVTLFWSAGTGGSVPDAGSLGRRLAPAAERFEAWAAADVATAQASYGWAQLCSLAAILAAGALAARLPARAFGRITRWRRVADPPPRPAGLPNLLGLGYAVMVLAFAAQTVLLVAAWDVGRSTVRWPLLAAAAEASVVAGAGALLTAGLLVLWAVDGVGRRLR